MAAHNGDDSLPELDCWRGDLGKIGDIDGERVAPSPPPSIERPPLDETSFDCCVWDAVEHERSAPVIVERYVVIFKPSGAMRVLMTGVAKRTADFESL